MQYFFGPDLLVSPVTGPIDSTTGMFTGSYWMPVRDIHIYRHVHAVGCACIFTGQLEFSYTEGWGCPKLYMKFWYYNSIRLCVS